MFKYFSYKLRLFMMLPLVFVLIVLSSPAGASLVTFTFEGNVDDVDPLLNGSFDTMQTLSVTYTFESTAVGTTTGNADVTDYYALSSMNLTLGGYSATYDPFTPSAVGIVRVYNTPTGDGYEFIGSLAGSSVSGMMPDIVIFSLGDDSGSLFSSTSLPVAPPQFSSLTYADWELIFTDPNNPLSGGSVIGQITSWTAEPISNVPIPSAVGLLASGLLGLTAVAQRSRKKHKASI